MKLILFLVKTAWITIFCYNQPFILKAETEVYDSIHIAKIFRLTETNLDSALVLAHELEQFAKGKNDQYLIARAYSAYSYIYYLTGDYKEANKYGIKAAEIFQNQNQLKNFYETYIRLGAINMLMGNYLIANDYLMKAVTFFENTSDTLNLIRTYINQSGNHIMLNNLKASDSYSRKAYRLALIMKNDFAVSKALNNIAIVLFKQNKISEARDSFIVALNLAKNSNENQSILNCLNYLGQIEMVEGNFEKSLYYYNQLVSFSGDYVDQFVISSGFINKGKLLAAMNNLDEAISTTELAIETATRAGDKAHLRDAYFQMFELLKISSKTSESLDYLEKTMVLNDSLMNDSKHRIIYELETIYQTRQKEIQISEIQKEKQRQEDRNQLLMNVFILSISLLLITIVLILLIIRHQQKKNRLYTLDLNLRLLRSQLNPHFVFNSLGAVQNYILNKSPQEAATYLSKFSKLMRLILINSSEMLVTLENEIETLTYYLELQKLRFDERIFYGFEIDEEIKTDEILIPPMLLQPFIENSIEHNLSLIDRPIQIQISIIRITNNMLKICLTDNGIGREKSTQYKKPNHRSFATKITNDRIAGLKKSGFQNIEFMIIDLKEEDNGKTGTKVIFSLPLLFDS